MKLKRILSGVIGFPIVALILIFGNIYVIDVLFTFVAIIALYEYFSGFKSKYKPIEWIGYLSCILISFLHIIPKEYYLSVLTLFILLLIAVLFIHVVVSNMKIGIPDIMITFFGTIYITFFLSFIPLLYGTAQGKYLIWYILISAWGTDTCAYFVGCKFGKHKFSKISPKKSIEGCVAGTVGAIAIALIYTFAINKFASLSVSYISVALMVLLLSILSQVGDLSASSIKRAVNIKDFGSMIPGHGGMLDRIDSVIFIAPFAYFLLTTFI